MAKWLWSASGLLPIAALVFGIVVLVSTGAAKGSTADDSGRLTVPLEPVAISGMPADGTGTAPVVVMEFSDFQCPFCGEFARLRLPALRERFVLPGTVLFVFRHFPLSIHPLALEAAKRAVCTNSNEEFWRVHDALFADPVSWATGEFGVLTRRTGTNGWKGSVCAVIPWSTLLDKDLADGHAWRVHVTPTFFVGRRTVGDRVTVDEALEGLPGEGALEAAIARSLAAR
jgi:protein-disulfide isomerase